VVLFWGSKVKGQGHKVNKCIFHTNVRSITQKWIIPKCSNLIQGMALGYPESGTVLGWKVKGQGRVRVMINANVCCLTQKRMIPKCWYREWPWDILQKETGLKWVERWKVNVRVMVNSNVTWVRTLHIWVPSSCCCFCYVLVKNAKYFHYFHSELLIHK